MSAAHRSVKFELQEVLSQRLGKPQSFVSKYEHGERRLDVIELITILTHLGVVVDAFVGELMQTLQANSPKNEKTASAAIKAGSTQSRKSARLQR